MSLRLQLLPPALALESGNSIAAASHATLTVSAMRRPVAMGDSRVSCKASGTAQFLRNDTPKANLRTTCEIGSHCRHTSSAAGGKPRGRTPVAGLSENPLAPQVDDLPRFARREVRRIVVRGKRGSGHANPHCVGCCDAQSESDLGVRRDKAALSSGCKPHPATAPAGSNRSSHGGNEVAEAFG